MLAGWLSVVEFSPNEGQNGMRLAAAINSTAASAPSLRVKVTSEPKRPPNCRAAKSWSGWLGKPG